MICSDWRAPNSLWKAPSGTTANSSSELPKIAPCFSLTPMTRKCTPRMRITLSIGSTSPKSLSATPQPRIATGRLRWTSSGLIMRPRSASKVEKSAKSPATPCTRTDSSSSVP